MLIAMKEPIIRIIDIPFVIICLILSFITEILDEKAYRVDIFLPMIGNEQIESE